MAEIQIHRGFLPHGHLNQRRGHVVKRFCDIFDLFVKIGLFIGLCLLATIVNVRNYIKNIRNVSAIPTDRYQLRNILKSNHGLARGANLSDMPLSRKVSRLIPITQWSLLK